MISIALLGVGRLARHVAGVFQNELKNSKISVVCDLDRSKAEYVSSLVGGRVETDSIELFRRGDFDVVYIATESGNHYRDANSALRAKKHVIVEKPPTLMPEQTRYLAQEFEKAGLMYAVILQNRFNPAIQILKKTMEEGRFGKLVLATVRVRWCRYQSYYEDGWHGTWALDGGVINQQAYHHLDALQWICGPIKKVVAAEGNMLNKLEAEDTLAATVVFQGGALGIIEATTAARPMDFEASISVVGENGTAIIGGIALNRVELWQFVDEREDDTATLTKYSQEVPTGYGLSHGPLIQEIINRLHQGTTAPPISGFDALPAVQLVHALYKSVEIGGWVSMADRPMSDRLGH